MNHQPGLRYRQVGLFLKGPIPFCDLSRVFRCGAKCLPVYLALRLMADIRKGNTVDVSLVGIAKVWEGALKPGSIRRSLNRLERENLIRVQRTPGCKLHVQLLKLPSPVAEEPGQNNGQGRSDIGALRASPEPAPDNSGIPDLAAERVQARNRSTARNVPESP